MATQMSKSQLIEKIATARLISRRIKSMETLRSYIRWPAVRPVFRHDVYDGRGPQVIF